MANPDFVDEGTDQGGNTSYTAALPPSTAAGQILLLVIATDGFTPTLSTPNGFVLAQDPNGNTASVNQALGTCGLHVFWKRAVGGDLGPVVAAPSGGGTVMCSECNTYSGCRSTGVPFHIITTATVGSATTSVAPPAVTPTLNGCTVLPMAASANDDSTFNDWTLTGAASPTGQIDNGWHNGTGNACAFTGGRGGYATAGGARSGTTTFGAATVQAQIVIVLASLPEVTAVEEDVGNVPKRQFNVLPAVPNTGLGWDEEVFTTATVIDDDGPSPTSIASFPAAFSQVGASSDDPVAVAAVIDDDGSPPSPFVTLIPWGQPSLYTTDDLSTAVTVIDEDPGYSLFPIAVASSKPSVVFIDDLASTATAVIDDDPAAVPFLPTVPANVVGTPNVDEIATGTGAAMVEEDPSGRPQGVWSADRSTRATSTDDSIPSTAPAATVAGAGGIQRSNGASPNTGTLTSSTVPAWQPSTAYVIDPSIGGTNRVQNGGNLYQCSTDGTSASSGGPTGTSTNISDGSTSWYFVGTVQPTSTTANSQVLAFIARGTQSSAASIDPRDNDSGTFTVISNNQYVSFAGSFAGVWRRTTASNSKAAYTVSADWGVGESGGDEVTVGYIELTGVTVGSPHASSHVERALPTGGTVTAASITTTVQCLIVSLWFGNGTVQTAGTTDTAAPAGGLQLIANASFPLSLTTAGYIQEMAAWRIASAGTFAEVWTSTTSTEGAQLYTVAYPLSNTSSTVVDSDDPVQAPQVWFVGTQQTQPSQVIEELSQQAVIDQEDSVTGPGLMRMAVAPLPMGGVTGDELGTTPVPDQEEFQLALPSGWNVSPMPVFQASLDEVGLQTVIDQDDPLTLSVGWIAPVAPFVLASADELGTPSAVDQEEAPVAAAQWIALSTAFSWSPSQDESLSSVIDDGSAATPWPIAWISPTSQVGMAQDDQVTLFTGVGSMTDGPDSALGAGLVELFGAGAVTLGDDSLTSLGVIGAFGGGDIGDAPDSGSGAGSIPLFGSGAITVGDDSLVGSGSMGPPPATSGSADITLGNDTVSASDGASAVPIPSRVVGGSLPGGTARRLPIPHVLIRIEDIDRGVRNWFDRVADIHVGTPQGDRRKVVVKFSSGERWVAAADRQGIRDRDGRLILPVIQVRRTGVDVVSHMGALGTDTPRFQLARLVSEKTTALANLDQRRPISDRRLRGSAVYDIYTIPFPRQNVLSYEVRVQAQYQTHMNEIIEKVQSRLNFVSVPSFVIGLNSDSRKEGIHEGRGSVELGRPEQAAFENRPSLAGYYVVGYVEGALDTGGNLDEFTDQERIIELRFSFRVPASLLLDPDGTAPDVAVERTAFNVEMTDEQVHFVDDPADLDRIFGSKK